MVPGTILSRSDALHRAPLLFSAARLVPRRQLLAAFLRWRRHRRTPSLVEQQSSNTQNSALNKQQHHDDPWHYCGRSLWDRHSHVHQQCPKSSIIQTWVVYDFKKGTMTTYFRLFGGRECDSTKVKVHRWKEWWPCGQRPGVGAGLCIRLMWNDGDRPCYRG
jgi:hypothetical protein